MRNGSKRLTAWVAVLAIALQAVLAGSIGPTKAALGPAGSAAVICHADGGGADPLSPVADNDCCANCILCNTLATGWPPANALDLPAWPSYSVTFFTRIAERVALRAHGIHFPRGPPVAS